MQNNHRIWLDTNLPFRKDPLLQGMIVLYVAFWGWMAIEPYAWSNWWLENLLVLAACAVLGLTFRRFRFSNVSYALIVIFLTLLVAPEVGTRFLGTQGDVWDAQHDMEVALYGAVAAMVVQGGIFLFQKKRLRPKT